MYLSFFGLKEQPFGVTPDPRFLYLSEAHKEALASLYYGIEANRGFIGLIAQPGMGKTTMLFHMLETFRTSARIAFLFQTHCNSREFMRLLLAELGCEEDTQDLVRMYDEFNTRLLKIAEEGNRLIVVVDEAQNLEPEVLETLRLLSNFETSTGQADAHHSGGTAGVGAKARQSGSGSVASASLDCAGAGAASRLGSQELRGAPLAHCRISRRPFLPAKFTNPSATRHRGHTPKHKQFLLQCAVAGLRAAKKNSRCGCSERSHGRP